MISEASQALLLSYEAKVKPLQLLSMVEDLEQVITVPLDQRNVEQSESIYTFR